MKRHHLLVVSTLFSVALFVVVGAVQFWPEAAINRINELPQEVLGQPKQAVDEQLAALVEERARFEGLAESEVAAKKDYVLSTYQDAKALGDESSGIYAAQKLLREIFPGLSNEIDNQISELQQANNLTKLNDSDLSAGVRALTNNSVDSYLKANASE